MHPILLDLGWRDLPLLGRTHLYLGTYGLFFALAALSGWLLWMRHARQDGLDRDRMIDLGFWALIAGLAGSKAGLILTDPAWFLSSPAAFLSILRAAGVLLFGVLAAVFTIVLWTRRHGIPFWRVADSMAPALALGQAIGRAGCLFAGCCYGQRAPGLPWGIRFTNPDAAAISGTPLWQPDDPEGCLNVLHPTQAYQGLADLLLLGILLLVRSRKAFAGRTALVFIVGYSVSRFTVELFRGDVERGIWALPGLGIALSTSQILSVLGLLAALAALPVLTRSGAGDRRKAP